MSNNSCIEYDSELDNNCSGCEDCLPIDEYEGYDEYYENEEDGGYFLYGDAYLKTIPGYSLFCKDQLKIAKFTRHELNCKWKTLKETNTQKYIEYILKHKTKFPKKYKNYTRGYGPVWCFGIDDCDDTDCECECHNDTVCKSNN